MVVVVAAVVILLLLVTVVSNCIGTGHMPRPPEKKCPHNRRRRECKVCGGSSICHHNHAKRQCKDCGGSQICEHNSRRACAPVQGMRGRQHLPPQPSKERVQGVWRIEDIRAQNRSSTSLTRQRAERERFLSNRFGRTAGDSDTLNLRPSTHPQWQHVYDEED